jgi:hypothetical protein
MSIICDFLKNRLKEGRIFCMGVNEIMRMYRKTLLSRIHFDVLQIRCKLKDKSPVKHQKTLCFTWDLSFTFIKIYGILRIKDALIKSVYCAMKYGIFNPLTSLGWFKVVRQIRKVTIFRVNFFDKLQVSQPRPLNTIQSHN